jgi:two-component system CheB/CheR fusion protein
VTDEPLDDGFEDLLDFIKQARAFDFTGYKRPSLRRRVSKRLATVGCDGFVDYKAYLEANADEFHELFNTILINVTGFFRDTDTWNAVRDDVIPKLVEQKHASEPIRIWSAGCASGEEPYSLIIAFCEAIGEEATQERVKVYATDVDGEALAQARHAEFPATVVHSSVPSELIAKYFDNVDGRYAFRKDLRRTVIFGRNDLVRDPPISRVDLLTCRNTLMYFQTETQRRILENFHFALAENGFLLLGKSEVLAMRTGLFVARDLKRRIFVKVPSLPRSERIAWPLPVARAVDEEAGDAQVAIREASFDAAPVAQLVVGVDSMLALANHQARVLLGITTRDIGRPFSELDASYRPVELRSRIDEVKLNRHHVSIRDVEVLQGRTGETRQFDVQLAPLLTPSGSTIGVSIAFVEVTRFRRLQEDFEQTQRELETAYEELQSTVEELETTNEELQSTNEELETTNEELHSTNEELETLNEELQSTNEELETMNDELRERTDELNSTNAFLESVFASFRSGVAVLTRDLTVRVWTREAQNLWGLPPNEVVGVHFLNLDIGLPVEQLRTSLRAVLSGKADAEVVPMPAVNRRGKHITCRVTISPLQSRRAEIDGLIVIMDELTAEEAPG